MAGKYGIGARVRDEDGDEGVIVGKRKGERLVRYGADLLGIDMWVPKSKLTVVDDTPAPVEQEQGEPKIEVGDRVRCTKDYDPGVQFTAGKEYVVRYVTTYSIGVVADDSGGPNVWSRKYFELVTTPEWQPKVGDRVRFTDECREYWWFGPQKKYKDGTVSKTDGGGELPIHVKCSNGETAFVNADQIEPLPVAAEGLGAGNLEDDVTAIFDELVAWMGKDNPVAVPPVAVPPVAVAPATATPIKKRDLVTLAQPALVTGIDRHHAHLLLATGGTYTLPVAALVAAA